MSFMSSYIETVLSTQLKQNDKMYKTKVRVLKNVVAEKDLDIVERVDGIADKYQARAKQHAAAITELLAEEAQTGISTATQREVEQDAIARLKTRTAKLDTIHEDDE